MNSLVPSLCYRLPGLSGIALGIWIASRFGFSYMGGYVALLVCCAALIFFLATCRYLVDTNAPELGRWLVLASWVTLGTYALIGPWLVYAALPEHDWRLLVYFGLLSIALWLALLLFTHKLHEYVARYFRPIPRRPLQIAYF